MISKDFKEILERFSSERLKDFSLSSFPFEFQDYYVGRFQAFLNDDVTLKASCGQFGWVESPWINIISKVFDNHHEALLVEYRFDAENLEINLSIIPRLEDFNQYLSVKDELIRILEFEDFGGFEFCKNPDSFSIISKKYSIDELTERRLLSDLEHVLSIYKRLIPYFTALLNEEPLMYKASCEDCDMLLEEKALFDIAKPRVIDIKTEYPTEKRYRNDLNDPKALFNDKTIEKIALCEITHEEYLNILSRINDNARTKLQELIDDNDIDLADLAAKDKILILSKSFANTQYKSIGKELGFYSFNTIRVDDRLSDPLIITSAIHELSHFILEKILKEILMMILDTNDTPLISSFIKITLEDNELNYLLDEFCAHTVEGRFALYGYQDYSSFQYKLDEISHLYSKEDIDYAMIIANTFAYDIKDILEDFIDAELRDEIKKEFLDLPYRPDDAPLDLEIESRFGFTELMDAVSIILTSGIPACQNQLDKLERYMVKYSKCQNIDSKTN